MKFYGYILLIFVLPNVSCKNENDKKINDVVLRKCECPMQNIYDNKIQKDSVSFGIKDDYDWNIGGAVSANIRKIINLEIEASNRSSENRFQIATSTVVQELRSDYPELINKSFEFKLKRVSFCTFHDIICQDTTISDSIKRNLTLIKLEEFNKSFENLFTEKDKSIKLINSKMNINKPDDPIYNKVINSTIYTENQSGGNNTVNINNLRTSASYQKPSPELMNNIQSQLEKIKEDYKIPNVP